MNYASTNEPENHEPMTMLDPQGMEASVSDYMQSAEFKRKLASKQEDKVSNELGTREHYEEYVRNCEDAGIMPVSWASWEIQYPQPIASAPASVERLEELAPELQREILNLAKFDNTGIIVKEFPHDTEARSYSQMGTDGLMHLTERGAAMVTEYQRRQAAQDELDMLTYEAVMHKPDPMRTVDRKEHNAQVAALKAENARLQRELDAAREALAFYADKRNWLMLKMDNGLRARTVLENSK